jgi:hypothetical protein
MDRHLCPASQVVLQRTSVHQKASVTTAMAIKNQIALGRLQVPTEIACHRNFTEPLNQGGQEHQWKSAQRMKEQTPSGFPL